MQRPRRYPPSPHGFLTPHLHPPPVLAPRPCLSSAREQDGGVPEDLRSAHPDRDGKRSAAAAQGWAEGVHLDACAPARPHQVALRRKQDSVDQPSRRPRGTIPTVVGLLVTVGVRVCVVGALRACAGAGTAAAASVRFDIRVSTYGHCRAASLFVVLRILAAVHSTRHEAE